MEKGLSNEKEDPGGLNLAAVYGYDTEDVVSSVEEEEKATEEEYEPELDKEQIIRTFFY